MRQRNYLTADQWDARLNRCMELVLGEPERFPECIRMWAEWRRKWLRDQRQRKESREVEHCKSLILSGLSPSARPEPAGGFVAKFRLRRTEKKVVGGRWSV